MGKQVDSYRFLDFITRQARSQGPRPPLAPPPIAKYLKRHPWALPKLFSRDVPEMPAGVAM